MTILRQPSEMDTPEQDGMVERRQQFHERAKRSLEDGRNHPEDTERVVKSRHQPTWLVRAKMKHRWLRRLIRVLAPIGLWPY